MDKEYFFLHREEIHKAEIRNRKILKFLMNNADYYKKWCKKKRGLW